MSFATGDPNLLDDWLIVGAESALRGTSGDRPFRTRLAGARLALWRDEDDALHAIDEADGAALAVQARYRYLWICARAPRRALFAFPEFDEPGRRIVDCGGIGVAASGLRVVENFLDLAHFPYVHGGLLGELPHTEVAPYVVSMRAGDDELVATECRFWQPKAAASAERGIEASYVYRAMQPFTAILYKSSPQRDGARDAIGLFVQPTDEERCIAHCLLVCYDDASTDAELIAFQQTIFAQDKPILENHAPRRLPIRGRLETPGRADLASVAYRRWLARRGMRFGVEPGPP